MKLSEDLKTAGDLLARNPFLTSEPGVKKSCDQLKKAVAGFLEVAAPYDGLDWKSYAEITAFLSSLKITEKSLPEINKKLKKHGFELADSRKTSKLDLAFDIAYQEKTAEVIEALSAKPEDKYIDDFNKMALMKPAAATRCLNENYKSPAALKKLLAAVGVPEKKTKKGTKQVFDREATVELLKERLKEHGVKIKH